MSFKANFYALLIGIDCYLPNKLPKGGCYHNLSGCVQDTTQIEEFLRGRLQYPSTHILKLTASYVGSQEPPEPRENWPTYENIVAAFQKLTDVTQPGDQVYIHYSGHGGRIPTKFPELKTNGFDEALVPTDIGNSEARYLRDVELVHILNKMVRRGLVVTLVFDSCHSGGMSRSAGDAVVRGVDEVDTTERSLQSLVASDAELATTWQSLAHNETRNLKLSNGSWLMSAKGYVLLSACRPSEVAYECANEKGRNGVLTYWLLNSFKQLDSGSTYKHLHDCVVAKVYSQFQQQTPQLQGESDRVVFNGKLMPQQHTVNVIRINSEEQKILLNTGQSHAMRKGACFIIYQLGTTNFSQLDRGIALVEIVELGATNSEAKIVQMYGQQHIELGCQAVLVDLGSSRLRQKVRLLKNGAVSNSIDQQNLLEQIKTAIISKGSGFLEWINDDRPADYQVIINTESNYEICNPSGQPIPNLYPALHCDDQEAASQIVRRLVHLAKYHNILQLDNPNSQSPLSNKLLVELVGTQSEYDPDEQPDPTLFQDSGNTPVIKSGEWIFIRIRNNSSQVLNVTLLDLQPDWGISQIYPSEQDTYFWPFDPQEEILLPLQAQLPSGYIHGVDIIKAFATIEATNFRWLELPALDQPQLDQVNTTRSLPKNSFEKFLASIALDEQSSRHLNSPKHYSREWITAQILVRIQQ